MAQQRQPFRFRLPWLGVPQQASAAPRPSQKTQTQTQEDPAAPLPSHGAQPSSQPAPADSRPSQQAQAPAGLQPNQATQGPAKTAPAAPRPKEVTQAASQRAGSLAQRAPFRPAGVTPMQPTPSARSEPPTSHGTSQLPPRSQETQPLKDSPASPPQKASQVQSTSRPASSSQASSKVQQAPKTATQFPSPSRGGAQATKPKVTAAPPTTPSQANLTAPVKKPAAIATEVSQNSEEHKKRGTSKPPSEETKPVPKTVTRPEKVVDLLNEQKQQSAFEEPKEKATTKYTPQVSSPKRELKPQPEVYTTSYKEPEQMPKDNRDKPKKEAMTNNEVQGLKVQTKAHALEDELGQQSDKEVYDVKEDFQNIKNGGPNTEREVQAHERGTRFPQKHAAAGGQTTSFQKEIKENLPKLAHKNGAQGENHILYDKPLSIVNLTGENIGATMHLSSDFTNKKTPIHIHRGYKINSDKGAEKTTGDEENSRKRKYGDTKLEEDLATKSYVNNNVQGLNNSLVFNSSVTERNPGVHMVHHRNPIEPIKEGKDTKMLETRKAEVVSTPSERLTYAPTIRRRCLRGLLMESSDSDPEKPRRHVVGCTQKSKDGTINLSNTNDCMRLCNDDLNSSSFHSRV